MRDTASPYNIIDDIVDALLRNLICYCISQLIFNPLYNRYVLLCLLTWKSLFCYDLSSYYKRYIGLRIDKNVYMGVFCRSTERCVVTVFMKLIYVACSDPIPTKNTE